MRKDKEYTQRLKNNCSDKFSHLWCSNLLILQTPLKNKLLFPTLLPSLPMLLP